MSIDNIIAKRLLIAHTRVLSNSGGWWTDLKELAVKNDKAIMDEASISVSFDNGVKLACELANDEQSKVVGLQKYASLPDGYGMVFPFDPPATANFHMASVPFNIDIIFIGDDSRVTRIVPNIEPGTRGQWGMPHTSAVVEAVGGFARVNGIGVGTQVDIRIPKHADYNLRIVDSTQDPDTYDTVLIFNDGTIATFNSESGSSVEFDGPHGYIEYDASQDAATDGSHNYDEHYALGRRWETGEAQQDPTYDNFKSAYLNGDMTLEELISNCIEIYPQLTTEISEISAKLNVSELSDDAAVDIFDELDYLIESSGIQDYRKARLAQEIFPSSPRKDINPKMVPSNPTQERFKDRDLSDISYDFQFMDHNHEEQLGYDPVELGEQQDIVGPTRSSSRE
jgi:uncharacterized membrane protein (UPF0127 family)